MGLLHFLGLTSKIYLHGRRNGGRVFGTQSFQIDLDRPSGSLLDVTLIRCGSPRKGAFLHLPAKLLGHCASFDWWNLLGQ
jgi:hypothetical protein